MTAPFFSVIIPVYNRAHVLREAIESVRTQSCQDFEIIVVDDGSRDNPRAVVERIADPRIHFIAQVNGGGGKARNAGIDQASGRFIAPLDSDDLFLPHHLGSMKTLLEFSIGMVGYARVRVDRGAGRSFLKPPRAIRPDEHMATYLLCDRGFIPTITAVMPREAFARERYDENLRIAQDTDLAIRLFLAGYQFRMLEAPGAVWNDGLDPNRISSGKVNRQLGQWLEKMRSTIPPRAYYGGLGWPHAKQIVHDHPLKALGLYLNATLRGCYRPSLAAIIFLQIFLGRTGYRRLADQAISWLRAGLRERSVAAES
jgi:GT2 family glycosyltransferase